MKMMNFGTAKAVLLATTCVALSIMPETAVFAQGYQAAEPKIDNSVPNTPAPDTKSTLKGGIQKTGKKNEKTQHFMFGAKKGQADTLKARAANDANNALKAQAQSSVGIIGVKFVAVLGKPPVINEIFPNTPADKVGLRVYDQIVAVDGVPTSGLTKDEVFDLIVGTPGTPVSLSILRNTDYSAVTCTRMDINELNDARVRRDYMIHM
jgi:C-terminal processing protease CtpA/Prc